MKSSSTPQKKADASVATASRDDLTSAAQLDRRRRILDATATLAREGGFDAVQMRAVAESADVALGTLYRYFPSKIHLLVCTLAREFDDLHESISDGVIPGQTPAERVSWVLGLATSGMQEDLHLTEAMTRAFMFADSSVLGDIHRVGIQLTTMISRAIQGENYVEGAAPSDWEIAIARVVSDVWLSALVSWTTGRFTVAEVNEHLDMALALILRPVED